MTLAATKTWQHDVNQQLGNPGASTGQKFIRQMVTSMLGFAQGAWTVDYSCDGTNAGVKGDANNRWTADNKLVWNLAGSAHSWMILKNDGPGTGFEVCLDLITTNSSTYFNVMTIAFSPSAGFTGGTTIARPTATDEVVMCSVNNWNPQSNATAWSGVLHVMMSTDGQLTRILFMCANFVYTFLAFDRVTKTIAGSAWPSPSVGTWQRAQSTAADALLYANINRGTPSHTYIGGGIADLYWTTETTILGSAAGGANANTIVEQQTFADDDSGEWPVCPIGLFSATSLHRGRKGSFVDLWMGPTFALAGDTYPDDGTKVFVQFGNVVFPWNGTTAVTA